MTILRCIFPVQVCVKSPFIFADVDASGIGIDTPALRNSDGYPLLPADHFKGLLREAYKALCNACPQPFPEEKLFGPVHGGINAYQPVRGSLHFADLVCEATIRGDMTRITIDEKTGTVKDGMLQVVELAAPLGKEVAFQGSLIWHGTELEAVQLQSSLHRALRVIPYFGGIRSAGFGQHVRNKSMIGEPKYEPVQKQFQAAAGKRYRVTGTFDRPIAVNVTQLAENIFDSGTVVPGAAIKAALAEMLAASCLPPLDTAQFALSTMRVSHAHPISADGDLLDRALPLSHVHFKSSNSFASALGNFQDPGYDAKNNECGVFLPDMKGGAQKELRKIIKRPQSNFDAWSLGHTRIEPSTGAAADNDLFVVIARDTRHHTYQFETSLPDDGEDYAPLLSLLNAGLDRVGKTEARLLDISITPIALAQTGTATDTTVSFMLETPALFIVPKDGDDDVTATVRLEQYFNQYGLTLDDHYCQRVLAGGYPVLRTQCLGSYRPFALFTAGSCFRVSGSPAAVQAFRNMAANGLDVLREGNTGSLTVENDWKRCLYLPQNGYGEVSFNPDFRVVS